MGAQRRAELGRVLGVRESCAGGIRQPGSYLQTHEEEAEGRMAAEQARMSETSARMAAEADLDAALARVRRTGRGTAPPGRRIVTEDGLQEWTNPENLRNLPHRKMPQTGKLPETQIPAFAGMLD